MHWLRTACFSLAEEQKGPESGWTRPRKRRIRLRVGTEGLDWFKRKRAGPAFDSATNQSAVAPSFWAFLLNGGHDAACSAEVDLKNLRAHAKAFPLLHKTQGRGTLVLERAGRSHGR